MDRCDKSHYGLSGWPSWIPLTLYQPLRPIRDTTIKIIIITGITAKDKLMIDIGLETVTCCLFYVYPNVLIIQGEVGA